MDHRFDAVERGVLIVPKHSAYPRGRIIVGIYVARPSLSRVCNSNPFQMDPNAASTLFFEVDSIWWLLNSNARTLKPYGRFSSTTTLFANKRKNV